MSFRRAGRQFLASCFHLFPVFMLTTAKLPPSSSYMVNAQTWERYQSSHLSEWVYFLKCPTIPLADTTGSHGTATVSTDVELLLNRATFVQEWDFKGSGYPTEASYQKRLNSLLIIGINQQIHRYILASLFNETIKTFYSFETAVWKTTATAKQTCHTSDSHQYSNPID